MCLPTPAHGTMDCTNHHPRAVQITHPISHFNVPCLHFHFQFPICCVICCMYIVIVIVIGFAVAASLWKEGTHAQAAQSAQHSQNIKTSTTRGKHTLSIYRLLPAFVLARYRARITEPAHNPRIRGGLQVFAHTCGQCICCVAVAPMRCMVEGELVQE